jgi:hypothetical protein
MTWLVFFSQITSQVKSKNITIQVKSSQVMTDSKIYCIKSSQVASQLKNFQVKSIKSKNDLTRLWLKSFLTWLARLCVELIESSTWIHFDCRCFLIASLNLRIWFFNGRLKETKNNSEKTCQALRLGKTS